MVKNFKKLLVLSSILVLISSASSFADMNVSRISGRDRYETALKVQQKYFNHADGNLAIIASGKDFRTALYGSYMANALKVPFYVIPNTGMSRVMLNELKSKQVNRAYIIGDYNKLNKSINNSLKSINITPIRYTDKSPNKWADGFDGQVWYTLYQSLCPEQPPGDIGNMILINDNIFPDLLSAIPFTSAMAKRDNMMLSGYYEDEYTKQNDYMDGYAFIIGGFNSVPSKYITHQNYEFPIGLVRERWLDEEGNYNEIYSGRIAGQNRYKTAIEIAKAYKPVLNKDIKTIILVDGTNYPDALASGTVATFENGAILLTQPNKLNEDTRDFIEENNIEKVIIVGGEKSVSKNVENELRGL